MTHDSLPCTPRMSDHPQPSLTLGVGEGSQVGRTGRSFSLILLRFLGHSTPHKFPLHHLTGDSFWQPTLCCPFYGSLFCPQLLGEGTYVQCHSFINIVLLHGWGVFLDAGANLYIPVQTSHSNHQLTLETPPLTFATFKTISLLSCRYLWVGKPFITNKRSDSCY